MRKVLSAFFCGMLVMAALGLGILRLFVPTPEVVPMDRAKVMETLHHPDEGSRMVLVEITMADRDYEPYYACVLLSDWQPCYVAPCRVYRPFKEPIKETWLKIAKDDLTNAAQCIYRQNPVGFGSVTPKK